jgi:obg-like ATPase 1
MPPKGKKAAEEIKVELGRPGNTLKMGIVGLPNVGKSSTFNLMSKLSVPAENIPFCTIDPNTAKVEVPDKRHAWLVEHWKPKSRAPASLQIVDIAGLVSGASTGEGMGNAFLSHINGVDGIFHCVRAFDDENVSHYENSVDPIRDMCTIRDELVAKDVEKVEKKIRACDIEIAKRNTKEAIKEREHLVKVEACLAAGRWIKDETWTFQEVEYLNDCLFLTAKPVIYLVNIGDTDYEKKKNKWLLKIKEWIAANVKGQMIPYSVAFEKDHVNDVDRSRCMIDKIINAGHESLDLVNYFTCGEDEVKSWTVRRNTKAPQAAGVIHTDFEKGFQSCDVMKYDDFVATPNEAGLKALGQVKQQGKEYIVIDGDIIFFRFNVAKGGKK